MLGDQIAVFSLGKGYSGEIKIMHKGSTQSHVRVSRHRAEIVEIFSLFFLAYSSSLRQTQKRLDTIAIFQPSPDKSSKAWSSEIKVIGFQQWRLRTPFPQGCMPPRPQFAYHIYKQRKLFKLKMLNIYKYSPRQNSSTLISRMQVQTEMNLQQRYLIRARHSPAQSFNRSKYFQKMRI